MYKLKRLMVGLDMSDIDEDLIRYSFFISDVIKNVDTIFFIHIENHDDIADLKELYPELANTSPSEAISHKIKQWVEKYKPAHREIETIVRIDQGDPLTKLLHLSKVHQIDLIVTGRKNILEGSGLLAVKLARRALCSVLCVPERAKTKVNKIFIPIDFSSFSRLGMEYALRFAKDNQVEIVCQHIYKLPKGYSATGKSPEEFGAIMEENSRRNYEEFISRFDTQNITIHARFSLDTKNLAPKIAYTNALVEQSDLIVIGSRGRTDAAATLLGSFAEKLLTENATVPMLVLKSKRKNLDMISALLQL